MCPSGINLYKLFVLVNYGGAEPLKKRLADKI